MICKTSLISFVIVLLAVSSYSAPIDKQPDSSPSTLINAKDRTVVYPLESSSGSSQRKDRSSEDSDEMTTEAVTRPPRGFQGKDSDEMTTEVFTRPPRGFQGKDSDEVTTDAFTRPPRGFQGKDSDEMTTEVFTRPPRGFQGKDSDEMTTEVFTRPPRGFEGKDSDEITTDAFTRPPRGFEGKDSDEMTTDAFTRSPRGFDQVQYPSTTDENKERTVEDFLYTTLESSTQFNQRALPPVESYEKVEVSSPYPLDNKQRKSVDDESSSLQSFGKSTGLLKDETDRESYEKSDKESSEKPQRSPKTVSIIPGKISETKIYSNAPSKTSVVIEPVKQEQLSEGENQSYTEETKSDN